MCPSLSAQVLPACDLQAELPQCLQLPTFVCETERLLQCGTRVDLCSGSRVVRGSGVCSGCGSRDLRGSVCSQVRSGSGHVRCSLCSRSGEVLRYRLPEAVLCRSLRSRSLDL